MAARVDRKPPPDNAGNVRGRIGQLKIIARQCAQMEVRDGADKDRAMAKHMKAIESALKKLQRRLALARKAEGQMPPAPGTKAVEAKKKSAKRAKKGDDDVDLLGALDSL